MVKDKSQRKRSTAQQGTFITKVNQTRVALASITENKGYALTMTAKMKRSEGFSLFVKKMEHYCPKTKKEEVQTMYFKGMLYVYGITPEAQTMLDVLKLSTAKQLGMEKVNVAVNVDNPITRANPMTIIVYNLLTVDKVATKFFCNEALKRLGMVCLRASHVKDQGFLTTSFKLKVIFDEGIAEDSVLTARTQMMAHCFTAKGSLTINKLSYSCTFSECCLHCKVTGHEIHTCQSYFEHVRPEIVPPQTEDPQDKDSEDEMDDEDNIN
jgi:hypothetical protein